MRPPQYLLLNRSVAIAQYPLQDFCHANESPVISNSPGQATQSLASAWRLAMDQANEEAFQWHRSPQAHGDGPDAFDKFRLPFCASQTYRAVVAGAAGAILKIQPRVGLPTDGSGPRLGRIHPCKDAHSASLESGVSENPGRRPCGLLREP